MELDVEKIKEKAKRYAAISYLVPDSNFYELKGEFVWESDKKFPSEKQISEAMVLLDKNSKESKKRIQRNSLLASSDWRVLPHSPLSEEEVGLWATYRQELRDFTSQNGWVDLEFPAKPE